MEEYVDEYGQPFPPHLVAEYKRQQRELEMNQGDHELHDPYDDEEDYDEDFDDDENEDVEYVDEEGNPIPKEILIQYRKERQQHKELMRQQHENQLQ